MTGLRSRLARLRGYFRRRLASGGSSARHRTSRGLRAVAAAFAVITTALDLDIVVGVAAVLLFGGLGLLYVAAVLGLALRLFVVTWQGGS